jgi:UDP-2,3-diacylglucosamine pyrophosphatase LpxH
MRIFASADDHRSPAPDDLFRLKIKGDYLRFLKSEVRPGDLYVHLGDTWEGWEYDLGDSIAAHFDLWNPEIDHLFMEGNHEDPDIKILMALMPGRFMRSFEAEGFRFCHGHDLDRLLDTPQERMWVMHISRLYRYTNSLALARWIKKWVDNLHRNNEPYLEEFKKRGWDRVLWGHTHKYFREGTIGNPGFFPYDRTILVVEKGTLTEVTI